jgi:hypothetical protein
MQNQGLITTIKTAFNLEVWIREKEGDKNIFDINREFRNVIHGNIAQAYGDSCPEEVIIANVNYLLQIALLGYLFSGICAYDKELRNKIPNLIVSRIKSEAFSNPCKNRELYEGIDSSNNSKGIYLNKGENNYRNDNYN